ncbi:PIG-L deacetylase family protein [Sphingomicrobium sediminis]|uniref:PIG-L family deacetylase n=1 Tax=Sphingomicrobium sediminis TaxID=2950949 RepID=A0A9X2EL68_9SPHN|nr:PIG-L family deacetylase [Sphingomicrobium sediminis]
MGEPRRILAVGAHPDDLELGCGGTLAKLAASGARIRAIVLSRGERGLPSGSNLDRLDETCRALGLLGVQDVVTADFPDTRFAEALTDMIAFLESEIRSFVPERLYTMDDGDRHQDHRTVHRASLVAARSVPQVLTYETPSSGADFVPHYFEELGRWLDVKLEAIAAHESQRHREYMHPDRLRAAAMFRGQQAGTGPSEGYAVMKLVA